MGPGPERLRRGARSARLLRGRTLALALFAAAACAHVEVRPEPVEHPTAPLSLDAAVALALRNNPDARLARISVTRAAALVDEASSAFWPELSVSDAFTRTDVPSRAFAHLLDQGAFAPTIDFNDPGTVSNFHASLGARATLYDGGRRRAELTRGEAALGAAVAADEAARSVVALDVARAWSAVHEARAVADAATRSRDALEQLLELARAERAAGAGLPLDEQRLEVALAGARARADTAHQEERRARAGLGVLLGLGVEEAFELEEPPAAAGPPGPLPELSDQLVRARAGRPELVGAEREVEAAAAGLRAAEAGWLPQLGISGELGFDDPNGALSRRHWLLGVDVAELVTDAVRTPIRTRRAAAELLAAHERGRKVLLGVELEVQNAWLDLGDAERRLAVASAERGHAGERLARARAESEAGAGRAAALLQAEIDDARARSDERVARLRRDVARIALSHAVGEFPARAEEEAGPQEGDGG